MRSANDEKSALASRPIEFVVVAAVVVPVVPPPAAQAEGVTRRRGPVDRDRVADDQHGLLLVGVVTRRRLERVRLGPDAERRRVIPGDRDDLVEDRRQGDAVVVADQRVVGAVVAGGDGRAGSAGGAAGGRCGRGGGQERPAELPGRGDGGDAQLAELLHLLLQRDDDLRVTLVGLGLRRERLGGAEAHHRRDHAVDHAGADRVVDVRVGGDVVQALVEELGCRSGRWCRPRWCRRWCPRGRSRLPRRYRSWRWSRPRPTRGTARRC